MAFIKQQSSQIIEQNERKHDRDCANLVLQLSDPSPTARRWAARDLADCPDSSGALVEQLQREQDSSVRGIILTTLTHLGDEEAVSGLVNCLRSEDASLRNEAIEAMKFLPSEVAPIMGQLLKDPDPDVRIFAVNVLESLRHEQVEEWLREVIEHDAHVNVCASAVDLLGEVGSTYSWEALENLKVRFPDEPFISFAADLALKRIRST
ncbi:HEAT repeat-containing protein [Geoalkalibacter ferrihydriticus]|uniref:PBS lyase n=2 Tax=Geoalkalibacter ferrihydriticus TaxID=392333 RepID=A0A0C2HJJ2_9BACT|nr:HEAT repeat domain-containing protein [Geoalkalibacter ferrihydriticus]KIH77221.1 PBS lyase [Geoalkalibacter ferrihydriticus DSM 17813]SDM24763.1 HEAT repeat-containing protein [Geoalkalibacter ferrihydriticus]